MFYRCSQCKQEKDESLFYKSFKNRCIDCSKKYAKEHPQDRAAKYEYLKKYRVTFDGKVTSLLTSIRQTSKNRNLECDIDKAWLKEKMKPMLCSVTGLTLSIVKAGNSRTNPFAPSIDRIDNNKGYTKDNCRIVSYIFNKAKSDYTEEDIISMLESYKNKEKCY